jgi:hypothetical protein
MGRLNLPIEIINQALAKKLIDIFNATNSDGSHKLAATV